MQNQVSTLKVKGKLEGLKFSCLFSKRRKHLGLGDRGRREIEEPAFAAIKEKKKKKENISACIFKEGNWGFSPPSNCCLFPSSSPWANGEDEANASSAWNQGIRLQLRWDLGMRHDLFIGQGGRGPAALHPPWKHILGFAKLKTVHQVNQAWFPLSFLVQLLLCPR